MIYQLICESSPVTLVTQIFGSFDNLTIFKNFQILCLKKTLENKLKCLQIGKYLYKTNSYLLHMNFMHQFSALYLSILIVIFLRIIPKSQLIHLVCTRYVIFQYFSTNNNGVTIATYDKIGFSIYSLSLYSLTTIISSIASQK